MVRAIYNGIALSTYLLIYWCSSASLRHPALRARYKSLYTAGDASREVVRNTRFRENAAKKHIMCVSSSKANLCTYVKVTLLVKNTYVKYLHQLSSSHSTSSAEVGTKWRSVDS